MSTFILSPLLHFFGSPGFSADSDTVPFVVRAVGQDNVRLRACGKVAHIGVAR
jgi:hypothetical protein